MPSVLHRHWSVPVVGLFAILRAYDGLYNDLLGIYQSLVRKGQEGQVLVELAYLWHFYGISRITFSFWCI